MAKFTIAPEALATIACLAKAINVDSARFEVSKDSLTAAICDLDSVFMGIARFPVENGPDEPIESVISLKRLTDTAMAMKSAKDALTVEVSPHQIRFTSGRKKRVVAADAPREDRQRIPTFQPPVRIEVPVTFLEEGIAGSNGIDDRMAFVCDGEQLQWRTLGKTDELYEDSTPAPSSAPAKSQFAVDFLGQMVKLMESDTCILYIGTDMPLRAEFAVDGGTATFFQAPLIEDS